jgi:Mesyanzhinovviridae DNA primase
MNSPFSLETTAEASVFDVEKSMAPDVEVAIKFLNGLYPDGPWLLTAIVPDGATLTRSFARAQEDELRQFIARHNADRNIYYSVNEAGGAADKKTSKRDMLRAHFLHADIDPRPGEASEAAKARILPELEAFKPAPTAIVDSGNGYQALWRLAEPIELDPARVVDVEARNEALAQALNCDTITRNIDRILPPPGHRQLAQSEKDQGRSHAGPFPVSCVEWRELPARRIPAGGG